MITFATKCRAKLGRKTTCKCLIKVAEWGSRNLCYFLFRTLPSVFSVICLLYFPIVLFSHQIWQGKKICLLPLIRYRAAITMNFTLLRCVKMPLVTIPSFHSVTLLGYLKFRFYENTYCFKYKILIFGLCFLMQIFLRCFLIMIFFSLKSATTAEYFFQSKNRTFLPSKCKSDVGMMLRYPHFHPNGAFFVIAVMLLLIMSNWVFGSA